MGLCLAGTDLRPADRIGRPGFAPVQRAVRERRPEYPHRRHDAEPEVRVDGGEPGGHEVDQEAERDAASGGGDQVGRHARSQQSALRPKRQHEDVPSAAGSKHRHAVGHDRAPARRGVQVLADQRRRVRQRHDRHHQESVGEHEEAVDPLHERQPRMVVDPHDQDRGEAEGEREVGRPLIEDRGDQVLRGHDLDDRDAEVEGQDRHRDRDDGVAERLQPGGLGSPGRGPSRDVVHIAPGA